MSNSEVGAYAGDGIEESIDVVDGVVQGRARTHGCRDAVTAVQRRRAVVTDPHRDAARVEELAGVVRVDALDVERPEAHALRARRVAEQADARDLREARPHTLGEHSLVGMDPVEAHCVEVAGPIGCVPASNRCGGGRYSARSSVTVVIIEPPVRNGGIASSTSLRP